MKLTLFPIPTAWSPAYTIDIPPGVPAEGATCSVRADFRKKKCGRPAGFHMTDGECHVQVCGIHKRTLRTRGWNTVQTGQ